MEAAEEMAPFLGPTEGDDVTGLGASSPSSDICRVCRGEATAQQPLFYPCLCSGSIKYVHQEW